MFIDAKIRDDQVNRAFTTRVTRVHRTRETPQQGRTLGVTKAVTPWHHGTSRSPRLLDRNVSRATTTIPPVSFPFRQFGRNSYTLYGYVNTENDAGDILIKEGVWLPR